MKEQVYIKQQLGLESNEFSKYVYKIDKALCGLKKAPRAWYERLSSLLLEHRNKRGKIDNTLYLKTNRKDPLIRQVYMDYIIF